MRRFRQHFFLTTRSHVRPAFTLTELLVSLAVLGVLIGLVVPALSAARRAALDMRCSAQMRSAAQGVTSYGTDARGYLPFAGYEPRLVRAPGGREYRVGGLSGVGKGRWALLLPEGWRGLEWDPAMRCARQPAHDPSVGRLEEDFLSRGYLQTPMFSLSRAYWIDSRTLQEDVDWSRQRVQPARIDQVVFASEKSLLFEPIAFCAWGPRADWAINDWGQTPYHVSSVSTVDGAVLRMRQADGLKAAFTWPFDATIGGVRGRDVPRSGSGRGGD